MTITNEDNMELMARYPDKYFDLAIVDPPYGIGANKMTLGNGKKKIYRGANDWDKTIPSKEYFDELFRVSKNQVIWGGLYKWLLDKYAKPTDKILDTHLGSGSIAIACHDYGFDLTACELDKEYFDKAMQRINNHTAQQKLF